MEISSFFNYTLKQKNKRWFTLGPKTNWDIFNSEPSKMRGRYPKIYKTLTVCKQCCAHDMCNDEGVCSPCVKKTHPSYYKKKLTKSQTV